MPTTQPASVADIMVVDDTPANLHLLIKILSEQGYRIRPITDGAQAITSAQLSPPDVMLLDVQMPGMSGYEVCKIIKADKRTCDVPVIFLTVMDDVNDIVQGFEVGGVDYITKPVREGELLARLKNQIELRSLQNQLRTQNQQQQQLLAQYKAAERALKESEEKFSSAFENTPLPTTIVRLKDHQYVDVNRAFIQQSGYSRDEIIGHTAVDLGIWQSAEQRAAVFRQVGSQGHSQGVEVGLCNKFGELKSVILFIRLIQLKGETYVIATGKDITQQKADQKKLTEQTHALTQTLKTLQTTQAELIRSAKMAALGNLVAGVAHEINTPVGTAIMTASTLENATESVVKDLTQGELKRSAFESYLDVAAECSQLISSNLNRAGELINSFKKVAVDQTSRQQRTFLLKSYLCEVITNLTPQIHKSSYQVNVYGSDTLVIQSDPGSLSQVVTNLLTNSFEHAYPDECAGNISLTIETQGSTVVLTYHDDGCGIPVADQSHIFEPFFTTVRDRGGSGLGLHLVYNIVTQTLRGTIRVDSSANQGTTFTITFPML